MPYSYYSIVGFSRKNKRKQTTVVQDGEEHVYGYIETEGYPRSSLKLNNQRNPVQIRTIDLVIPPQRWIDMKFVPSSYIGYNETKTCNTATGTRLSISGLADSFFKCGTQDGYITTQPERSSNGSTKQTITFRLTHKNNSMRSRFRILYKGNFSVLAVFGDDRCIFVSGVHT